MADYVKREVVQKKPRPASIEMIKNYRGSYSVMIDPYDFSMPAKRFSFRHDVHSQRIPLKFALGVFITNEASRALEKGLFTFRDLQDLILMAEEEGIYVPDSIKEPKILSKDLKNLLIKNDVQAIEKLMFNASKNNISNLIDQAKKNLDKLNLSTIEYIEKNYKVSLRPIKLDE